MFILLGKIVLLVLVSMFYIVVAAYVISQVSLIPYLVVDFPLHMRIFSIVFGLAIVLAAIVLLPWRLILLGLELFRKNPKEV